MKRIKKSDNEVELIFEKGLLYRMNTKCWWGKTNKVDQQEIGNVPKYAITGIKTLIDPKHLTALRSYKTLGDRILRSRAYPFPGIKGTYFVPKGMIDTVEEKLKAGQLQFYDELEVFLSNYEQYKNEWKEKIKEYYDERLYPTVDQLRPKFEFDWIKFSLSLPEPNVSSILNREAYEEEVQKHREKVKQFLDESLTYLAGKFYAVLVNLEKKLQSGDKLRTGTIRSVQTFIETFDKMNLVGNKELEKLVKRAEKAIGVDQGITKDINSDDKLRDSIKEKIGSIVSKIEKSKDDRLRRAIEF